MTDTPHTVSVVSLNIEGRKHLDRIKPFLEERRPDVFCVQELLKKDVPFFESILNVKGIFVPMVYLSEYDSEQGLGIFTCLEHTTISVQYAGRHGSLVPFEKTTFQLSYDTQQFHLLGARVLKDEQYHTILTTHLPVTEDACVTDYQREAVSGLLAALEACNEFVLCGDMNAPRGGEMFGEIAQRYMDNIPVAYTSSLDKELHRAGHLELMVDGLFSTPGYTVTDVELVSGVSDHCAVVANIAIV